MTKRYFKATDGTRTFFRASGSFVFASANLNSYTPAFSSAAPGPFTVPAVEIDRAEYNRLHAIKTQRTTQAYPCESYVLNSQLA